MIILKNKIHDFKQRDIDLIVAKLKAGKVIVLPTDTIYGLSCLSLNKKALKKISKLKKRQEAKPFINLVSSLSMAKKYALISRSQELQLKKIWLINKRPTTVILKAKKNLPLKMVSQQGTISFRLPKSDFLIKIIKKVGAPIVSTSLNLSGRKPLLNLNNINNFFQNKNFPDLLIDSGNLKRVRPSKLIDLRFDPPLILRK